MNSIHVRRMMQNLNTSMRDPPPELPKPRAPRQKKTAPPPASDSMSNSDSGSDSSHDEEHQANDSATMNRIKSYFESEPCEYISPAALGQTKTSKEAMDYLESKACPKVPAIKKSITKTKMESGPVSPAPPKNRKPKVEAAPVPAPATPAPAPTTKKVKAPEVIAAAAPPVAATPKKTKRPASEYSKIVGKYMKEFSIAEAHKRAKAELAAMKV